MIEASLTMLSSTPKFCPGSSSVMLLTISISLNWTLWILLRGVEPLGGWSVGYNFLKGREVPTSNAPIGALAITIN